MQQSLFLAILSACYTFGQIAHVCCSLVPILSQNQRYLKLWRERALYNMCRVCGKIWHYKIGQFNNCWLNVLLCSRLTGVAICNLKARLCLRQALQVYAPRRRRWFVARSDSIGLPTLAHTSSLSLNRRDYLLESASILSARFSAAAKLFTHCIFAW